MKFTASIRLELPEKIRVRGFGSHSSGRQERTYAAAAIQVDAVERPDHISWWFISDTGGRFHSVDSRLEVYVTQARIMVMAAWVAAEVELRP